MTNEGNYWSDLIWDEGVEYELDGDPYIDQYVDPYPLMSPISIW